MLARVLFIILTIQCSYCYSLNSITSAFRNLFSSNQNQQSPERDYQLESICFSTEASSNSQMPTKIHLVIVYDEELAKDLIKRSAKQYFDMLDSLIGTHAQFLKILEWKLPAKEYVSPYVEITYNNKTIKPVCILIFSDVGGKKSKSGRYAVSEYTKHVHIYVRKKDLQLDETEVSVIKALKAYRKKFGDKVYVNQRPVKYEQIRIMQNAPDPLCDMRQRMQPPTDDYNPSEERQYFGQQPISIYRSQYEDLIDCDEE